MKRTFIIVAAFAVSIAAAPAQYVPFAPKALLEALPKPAGWKVTGSTASTTLYEGLNTVAKRSYELSIEIEGEMQDFVVDLVVTDTGGESPELTELREMEEVEEPDFIIKKQAGRTLMLMLDESGMNLYRTDLFNRFVINLDTDLPREQAMTLIKETSFPKLRSAPKQRLPEKLTAFRAITYNELDSSKNSVREEKVERIEDIEDQIAAEAAELGILTADEEDAELEREMAEAGIDPDSDVEATPSTEDPAPEDPEGSGNE